MIICDIETCADVDISDERYIRRAEVKWVGIYVFEEDKYYLLPYTEKEQIKNLIKKYGDMIITFNGNKFDNPILRQQGYHILKFNSIDMWEVIDKHNGVVGDKLYSLSLRNCSKQILGEDIKGDINYEIFEKNEWTDEEIIEIKKYLKQDLIATKKLYDFYEKRMKTWGELMSDYDRKHKKYLTTTTGSFVYSVLCHMTGMKKEFSNNHEHKKFKGGFVAEPAGERFVGNIYMMDFNSMYPHAYMQGNLFSNKCKCCNEEEKWGANDMFPDIQGRYCNKKLGKKEQMIKNIYAQRMIYKKNKDPREYALKIILNTMYGVCGNPVFLNLYNRTTARDCTYIGRRCVKYSREIFDKKGYQIIYSDTDSVYLIDPFNNEERLMKVKNDIIKELKRNLPFPQDTFDMGIDEKPKAIFFVPKGDRFLKKHYVYITHENKIIIKGLKVIKNDCSKLSKLVVEKYIKPKIKETLQLKYKRKYIREWVLTELNNNLNLAGKFYKVKKPEFYKNEGQLQKQISLRYGKGLHFLIPNYSYGVGRGIKVCSVKEIQEKNISLSQLKLDGIYRELEPFMIGKMGVDILKIKKGRKVVLQNTLNLWK